MQCPLHQRNKSGDPLSHNRNYVPTVFKVQKVVHFIAYKGEKRVGERGRRLTPYQPRHKRRVSKDIKAEDGDNNESTASPEESTVNFIACVKC